MKKLIAIVVPVALVITAFAIVGPVGAGPPENPAVFEANIVDLDRSDPLDEGEVYVRADGSVKVKIEGALENATYKVYFSGHAVPPNWQVSPFTLIGTINTDGDGNGQLELGADTITTGTVTSPVFAINRVGASPATQFASGF